MNFDSSIPIYSQIMDLYKKEILKGELKKGDKILSQREFAKKYKVNPNTVQRAYREMEAMGLVEMVRGQGTFVCIDENMLNMMRLERAERVLEIFIEEMKTLGHDKKEVLGLVEKYWKDGK